MFARKYPRFGENAVDLEGDLIAHLWVKMPSFDRHRGLLAAFASRLFERRLISKLRQRFAARRSGELAPWASYSQQPVHKGSSAFSTPTESERQQFWIDVDRALFRLPREVRQTALLLSEYSVGEVSEHLGRSRSCIYDRIRQIRSALQRHAVDGSYFARSVVGNVRR